MPKREAQRKDIWLTDEDMQRVEMFATMMKRAGVDPNNQFGEVSVSKVIRWVLNGQPVGRKPKGEGES